MAEFLYTLYIIWMADLLLCPSCIGGVIVSVFPSSAVDHGFNPNVLCDRQPEAHLGIIVINCLIIG
jgi:hypothetical protein